MNYKGNDYREFISMFDAEEIAAMRDYLECDECGYDFSYAMENELAELVSIFYVKEWLIDNIRNATITGTEQLFNLFYMQ
ncbi:MAG: hypothetical protein IKT32_00740 [Clostridia bacterium]|nr:hypothetical protein [Clostridia bacterium]